ncbi:recombination mediator RecR [Crocinitomicaceae bacterium]|nr:recombination mediator RecR [Crocinitomicaceae bacterium]
MNIPSKHIENAVDQIASLPGIGRKTALRLVLQLMNRSKSEIEEFSNAFLMMKEHVLKCTSCGNISETEMCEICKNERRDHSIICVVEDIRDVLAIEGTQSYKGIYHVLNGIISPMDGIGPSDLNIESLIERVQNIDVNELIFALSATMEGDTTSFYLYKKMKGYDVEFSSLSRGVAIGSELQYADDITLSRSIVNRQPFQY